MSYTKQTWQNGDVITAEKLNHMEDGIADSNMLVIHATYSEEGDEYNTDITFSTAKQAVLNGLNAVLIVTASEMIAPHQLIGYSPLQDSMFFSSALLGSNLIFDETGLHAEIVNG